MELSKQLKLINRKFAYNTGKLPGFVDGTSPSGDSENLRLWMEKLQDVNENSISPHQMMKDNLNGKSFIGSDFDNAILNGSGYVSDDPYVKNPNLEPPQKISKQLNIGNIQTGLGGVGQLAAGIAESFNAKSKDEFLAEYKPVQRTVAGRAYTALAKAKDGKLPGYTTGKFGSIANSTIGGATAGSVAGPWGTVFGGAAGFLGGVAGALISGKKEEENERTVSNWVKQYNNGERGNTISQIMGEDNQGLYGNLYAQSLIHHANGKLPGFVGGRKPTYTVFGATNIKPNAKLSGKEIAYNKQEGIASEVGGPAVNNDSQNGFLRASDGVLSNKPGLLGYSPADLFRATGDILASEDYMIASNMAKGKNMYAKNGKLPRHKEGWLGNGIPALFGTVAGLGQYLDAIHNTPYHPRTYAANPYETTALNTLAGLRINPYPIARQLRDAEARSNRAIDMAGGLSGSQRTAARLANLNTTQGNISNLLSSIQQQNNAYRANYAQAALDAGNKSRAARMSANQWDLDYYSKAHAARNRGMQTGIANMLAQIQQYQANEFKRRQFNETMSLYRDDLKQKQDLFKWYANNFANTAVNPSTLYFNQMSPYEKWMLLQNRGIIK